MRSVRYPRLSGTASGLSTVANRFRKKRMQSVDFTEQMRRINRLERNARGLHTLDIIQFFEDDDPGGGTPPDPGPEDPGPVDPGPGAHLVSVNYGNFVSNNTDRIVVSRSDLYSDGTLRRFIEVFNQDMDTVSLVEAAPPPGGFLYPGVAFPGGAYLSVSWVGSIATTNFRTTNTMTGSTVEVLVDMLPVMGFVFTESTVPGFLYAPGVSTQDLYWHPFLNIYPHLSWTGSGDVCHTLCRKAYGPGEVKNDEITRLVINSPSDIVVSNSFSLRNVLLHYGDTSANVSTNRVHSTMGHDSSYYVVFGVSSFGSSQNKNILILAKISGSSVLWHVPLISYTPPVRPIPVRWTENGLYHLSMDISSITQVPPGALGITRRSASTGSVIKTYIVSRSDAMLDNVWDFTTDGSLFMLGTPIARGGKRIYKFPPLTF